MRTTIASTVCICIYLCAQVLIQKALCGLADTGLVMACRWAPQLNRFKISAPPEIPNKMTVERNPARTGLADRHPARWTKSVATVPYMIRRHPVAHN